MSQVEPIEEFDANGNWIYRRDSDGVEAWQEFDAKGNCIHYRTSNGYEEWWEYDVNSNQIHYRDSDGCEIWWWRGKRTEDPIKILILKAKLKDRASSA